jgi:hypothetical protein
VRCDRDRALCRRHTEEAAGMCAVKHEAYSDPILGREDLLDPFAVDLRRDSAPRSTSRYSAATPP